MSSPPVNTSYFVTNYPPRAQRSAEMPMPGGEDQQKLIDACTRCESLYGLYLQLSKLADDLEGNQTLKKHGFEVINTVNALRGYDWAMCELLHSMSPSSIKSIIQGTVAFDESERNLHCFEIPEKTPANPEKIPGVYVVGLCRRMHGGQGRFLNIKEMKSLISDLKDYVKGYEAYTKAQRNIAAGGFISMKNLSSDDQKAIRLFKGVDNYSGALQSTLDKGDPIFIEKDDEIPSIKALINTYESMCDITLDPTESIRMRQSPLYVGCSKDLANRTKVYKNNGSLKGINKPLGLTVSVLKRLHIDVEMKVVAVLRTWKPNQLAMAEQLIATLAGSLVYQHGFNAIETGGTGARTVTSDRALKINTEYVISRVGHIRVNLRKSIDELETRTKFLENLDMVRGEVVSIAEAMDACAVELQRLPSGMQWNEKLTELEELVASLKLDLKEKEEALQFWSLLADIQKVVVNETSQGIMSL
ncbi:hypothetical protein ACHAPJ_012949 [Fusarium lateritium]